MTMNKNDKKNINDENTVESVPRSSSGVGFFLSAVLWGVIGGLIGFIGGFFGPIIFQPNSPQGPLLGIFITGPLGVVIGFVFGAVRALRQR